ncbi:Zinc finger-like protein [Daphnia magna]|uniref:Zinc finger-like protein n=1 Tax=Daphnia magna TaxID=35525 RepID=A0A164HBJ3_9CRUS|nr:Zinc finger-like protein [Daphnia magna]
MKCPPALPTNFPRDSKKREFQKNILFQKPPNGESVPRDFLVWSFSSAALLCFPCSVFSKQGAASESSLLFRWNGGIKDNWRKLYDRVSSHQGSQIHQKYYLDWKTCLASLADPTEIDSSLQKAITAEGAKWRKTLRGILDVTLFLASRNLAFRDHLVNVARHQQEGSRMQAHYLSWQSQNEFIKECASIVKESVLKEIKSSIYYTIITDGTPDESHTEQINFVLRFVFFKTDEKKWEIRERFLGVEDMEKKKGVDITNLIFDVLAREKIDLQNCRGQGYDNGSNMAGTYIGAQALVLKKNSMAVYVPCSAHSLNLAGVHAAESSAEMKTFFGNIQVLFVFFSCSPARC